MADLRFVPSASIVAIDHPGHVGPSTWVKMIEVPSGDQVGWHDSGPLAVLARMRVVPLGLWVSCVRWDPSGRTV